MARRDDRSRSAPAQPEPAVAPVLSSRVVALCRIHAGRQGAFAPGEAFPEPLAAGLLEGVHFARG
jgi:hypothetical protein